MSYKNAILRCDLLSLCRPGHTNDVNQSPDGTCTQRDSNGRSHKEIDDRPHNRMGLERLAVVLISRYDPLSFKAGSFTAVHLLARQKGLDLPIGLHIIVCFNLLDIRANYDTQNARYQNQGKHGIQNHIWLIQLHIKNKTDDKGQKHEGHENSTDKAESVKGFDFRINALVHGIEVSFDQLVDGHIKQIGKEEQILHVRIGTVVLPVRYGLAGNEYLPRKIILGHAPFRAIPANLIAKFHTPAARFPWPSFTDRLLVDDYVVALS